MNLLKTQVGSLGAMAMKCTSNHMAVLAAQTTLYLNACGKYKINWGGLCSEPAY